MAETIVEYALANIARVEIETEETTPIIYTLTDVASEADVKAYISEGKEEELRIKNTIKAQNKTEDIVMGYDIRLVSVTMIPEVLALIDGGNWDGASKKYKAPIIGAPVERTLFTTNVYTEEKDADGTTNNYVKFVYKHCQGKPTNYTLRDGEFFVPELDMKARPKMGESPVEFEIVSSMPVVYVKVGYAATGSVTATNPATVTYDDTEKEFSVPDTVKTFTFTDDGANKRATLAGGTWTFTEVS